MTGAYRVWLEHTGLQEHTEYDWMIQDMNGAYRITGAYRI